MCTVAFFCSSHFSFAQGEHSLILAQASVREETKNFSKKYSPNKTVVNKSKKKSRAKSSAKAKAQNFQALPKKVKTKKSQQTAPPPLSPPQSPSMQDQQFSQSQELPEQRENEVDLGQRTNVRIIPQRDAPSDNPNQKIIASTKGNDKAGGPVQWAGSAGYAIRTDLADTIKPRLYVHTLSLDYGFSHVPTKMNVGAGISASYQSTGERRSEIIVDENDAELFVNDVSLSVGKGINFTEQYSMGLDFGNEFPTSPEARREGYNSVTSAGVSIKGSWFNKKISGNFSSGAHYIWNSYKYSPSTGDLNKMGGWRNSLGLRWSVWRGLFVSGSVGMQTSRYNDGTNDQTYRNSVSAGYMFSRFTITLGTSNGTYLNQGDANVWFIDEYRRMASLSMQLSF